MPDHNKRTQERSKVMLIAAVRFAGDPHVHRLRIRDIAAGGARLSYRGEVVQGDAVIIGFSAIGDVAGRIAWVGDGQIGVRFLDRIDPEAAKVPVTGEFRAAAGEPARQSLRRV